MNDHQFDAIVVGSGMSGGWAAKELTEKGLKVLLLERGRSITPEDYLGEHKAPWEFPFNELGDRHRYERDYPIQSSVRAFGEATEQFFVKDSDHPYVQDPDPSFAWIRGYHLGGRSLTWARCTPRWGPINFEENARDGHGIDWPIRYEDIRPWYDHVEEFAGISGQREHDFDTAPVGRFLPPMPLNACEEHAAQQIAAKFTDRKLIIAPTAVLTQEHKGRAACHFCGPCERGCSTGSYFSSISATLPAAQVTGNLTTVSNAIVEGLDHDPVTGKVTGVRVVDANTRSHSVYRARIVFLNASALGTTQILLNSASERFPNGLGNDSGVLGRYLMDHLVGGASLGLMPGFLDQNPIGHRPAGLYMPRFQNVGGSQAQFLRGFGFQGGASRANWSRGASTSEFGAQFKHSLRMPGPWTMFLGAMGECLPYEHNRVSLDRTRKDKWGIPLLRIQFRWGENERLMAEAMSAESKATLEAAGAVQVRTLMTGLAPMANAIHEMGTARMGNDPATSYLNKFNQAHKVPNLFVTDGACMTSSGCQNPSLTYMALTARAANHAVQIMQEGRL